MKLYRAMKVAPDGLPKTGLASRLLGVRTGDKAPNNDVKAVDLADIVAPGTGGMSVAPDDPYYLHPAIRPPEFGGTGVGAVWVIDETDLPSELCFRQNMPNHGMIEPP